MSVGGSAKEHLTSIKIPVTAGNIRNGHVYVRKHLWFFPKSSIRGRGGNDLKTEPIKLELLGLGTVETEIDADKGIFRWRGWRKFFRQQEVAQGDQLVFARANRRHFTVTVEHAVLPGLGSSLVRETRPADVRASPRKQPRRCNDLSGDEWLRYSVSVWSDIRKTTEELALNHPAMFPTMLCERLISMFLRRRGKHRVLDPFMGSGSTLVAAVSILVEIPRGIREFLHAT